ncbi:MAG: hypothetical protein KAS32_19105 [Candidatus Peribacteraceae bacterium]|nr:hypothetical protein [Candidatus Peribacteraceae bacterium]
MSRTRKHILKARRNELFQKYIRSDTRWRDIERELGYEANHSIDSLNSSLKRMNRKKRRAKEKQALRDRKEIPTFKKTDAWDFG